MYCFVHAQLDIFISSSICAGVASQIYKLNHIFQRLLLDYTRLVSFGVECGLTVDGLDVLLFL